MYIYKRSGGKYTLFDVINTDDQFAIEERLIKLLRKEKATKNIYNIKSKFTGLFTVYHFGGSFAFIVSENQLNEDGTLKIEDTVRAQ